LCLAEPARVVLGVRAVRRQVFRTVPTVGAIHASAAPPAIFVAAAPPAISVAAASPAISVVAAPPAISIVTAPLAISVVAAPPAISVVAAPPASVPARSVADISEGQCTPCHSASRRAGCVAGCFSGCRGGFLGGAALQEGLLPLERRRGVGFDFGQRQRHGFFDRGGHAVARQARALHVRGARERPRQVGALRGLDGRQPALGQAAHGAGVVAEVAH
jgi:hypothetical protein